MAGEASTSKARWELENSVQAINDVEAYYKYDAAAQQAIQQQKPWTKDPHYFKQCVACYAACSHHRPCMHIAPAAAVHSPGAPAQRSHIP